VHANLEGLQSRAIDVQSWFNSVPGLGDAGQGAGASRAHICRVHWITGGPRHLGIGISLRVQRICHIRAVVVLDPKRMSGCHHRLWHRHADIGPSRSDGAGGRRGVETSRRQRVATGNRHHASRGLEHNSFKSRAPLPRSARARLAACRIDGSSHCRRDVSLHDDRRASSAVLRNPQLNLAYPSIQRAPVAPRALTEPAFHAFALRRAQGLRLSHFQAPPVELPALIGFRDSLSVPNNPSISANVGSQLLYGHGGRSPSGGALVTTTGGP